MPSTTGSQAIAPDGGTTCWIATVAPAGPRSASCRACRPARWRARRSRARPPRNRPPPGAQRASSIVSSDRRFERSRDGRVPRAPERRAATRRWRRRQGAADGHAVGIAAEPRDVVANPSQRGLLVEQTVVARRRVRGILGGEAAVRKEAERPDPVVRRDHDDAALLGESPAVGAGEVGRRVGEPAGVEPDQDRRRLVGRQVSCPDVHEQAVFDAGRSP